MFQRSLATPSQESLSLSTGNNGSLMSWEEGHEEGLDIEEVESELPSDVPERDMREGVREGHGMSREEEPSTDLGRLVEDLVDLKEELEEELNGDCKKTSSSSSENQLEPSSLSEVAQGETSRSSGKNHQENSSTPEENPERTCTSKPDNDEENSGAHERPRKEAINKQHCVGHQDLIHGNNKAGSPDRDSSQGKQPVAEEQLNAETLVNAAEKDEQEVCREQATSKVLPKVAMFQVKAYQTKSSPETVRSSLKLSPRAPGAVWLTVNTKADDSTIKSPTESKLSDTATGDEDLPPPKVSELKKRFEQ